MKTLIDKLFRLLGYAPIEYINHNTFYEQRLYDIKELRTRSIMGRRYQSDLTLSKEDYEGHIGRKMIYELMKSVEPFVEFKSWEDFDTNLIIEATVFIGSKKQ